MAASTLLATPGVAAASGGGDGCNPGRTGNSSSWVYLGGLENNTSESYGGIIGFIDNYSPYVPSGSGNLATQWVMLANNASNYYYAQVGWEEQPSSNRSTVVQFSYGPGGDYWTNHLGSYPINQSIAYEVQYNPSCTNGKCFLFWANGTYLTYSGYNNWTPDNWQARSETHNVATQFPGGRANRSFLDNISRYAPAGSTGSWANASGILDGATIDPNGQNSGLPAWDSLSQLSANFYESWDTTCAQ